MGRAIDESLILLDTSYKYLFYSSRFTSPLIGSKKLKHIHVITNVLMLAQECIIVIIILDLRLRPFDLVTRV